MSSWVLALSLISRFLPYVAKVTELIERISTDAAIRQRLKKRALEMAFEAADELIARIEIEFEHANDPS